MAADKQGLVDWWTPAHVVTGALTRYAGIGPYAAAFLWIGFEVVENVLAEQDWVKEQIPASGAESGVNMVGDVIANSIGYAIVNHLMKR